MIEKFLFHIELTVINNMNSIISPSLTGLVLGKPFIKATGVILDEDDSSALFTDGVRKVIFRDGCEEVYEYQPSASGNTWGLHGIRPGRIKRHDPNNLKIPCMIGHKHFYNVYIDTCLPKNVMSLFHYNNICRWGMIHKGMEDVGIDDDVQVFVGNMTFTMSFAIVDNIEKYIDPRLSQVVFGAPFCKATSLVVDELNGIMTFTDGIREISYQTPYKMREFKEIDYEGLDGLSSQLVLCDDDVRRGCKDTFDLSSGFFKHDKELSSKYRNNPFDLVDPKYLYYESDSDRESKENGLGTLTNDGVT